jgi:adenylate cyclase
MPLMDRLETVIDHRWFVGDPGEPGRALARRTRRLALVAIALANAVGAAVVVSFALLALPRPALEDDLGVLGLNAVLAAGYTVLALVVGTAWGRRRLEGGRHGIRPWVEAEREPTPQERRRAVRAPARIMTVEVVLWGLATVLFVLVNLRFDPLLALGVGCTVALGGVTTSAAVYLLCELALRPIVARALAGDATRRRHSRLATRWLLAWGLGTGVPVIGLMLIGIVAVTPIELTDTTLGITMVALGAIALLFGAAVIVLAAYATVHPIGSIRRGLERVQAGDLDGQVQVWDTTEIGVLQAGFNDMVRGLRDRERLRDLFGRQVGADVAQRALDEDLQLGGEVREVTVLFVDLVGSTRLASERDPQEVVALLNRFFGVVVDVVEEAGGWVNKFEGDAALAIFGAPVELADHPTAGLRAARRLCSRLSEEVPELEAGVGVATGRAVAGNIGAERRFEYTVIGDPVNEAARLTDLAKQRSPRVLAAGTTLDAAAEDEASHWRRGDAVVLHGRRAETRLACLPGA